MMLGERSRIAPSYMYIHVCNNNVHVPYCFAVSPARCYAYPPPPLYFLGELSVQGYFTSITCPPPPVGCLSQFAILQFMRVVCVEAVENS